MNNSSVRLLILIALIVFACWLTYKIVKHIIKHKTETITAYTGGLGSGKTLMSVDMARKIYAKQVRKWKFKRWLNSVFNLCRIGSKKEFTTPKPLFFSNIPVKLNKSYAYELKKEHLLLQERLPPKSVILIDEIGAFASQFDYKDENVIKVFDEFVRFYRHYTTGGYIVCNDQCSENINLTIRRRLNVIHNLSNCFVLWRFCFYYERMMNISEEIKTIDVRNTENDRENDTQDNMVFHFKFLWHKKAYDTYCYSERYNTVPQADYTTHVSLKTLKLLKCPKDKEHKYTPKTDDGVGKEQEKCPQQISQVKSLKP